ncbi:hypothetical protein [Nonomuraea angiospora]|uniref:hypothetical protein n=1 Tax=Nonomuraea angiospora TaxID=46172 RepID=UPI0029A50B83|nr:hypothetical protein [Nonomuraea angiospora]MDX3100459.1 hypothetical protein [Nonomuraea angiospora]
MATLNLYLAPEEAVFGPNAYPQYQRNYGTAYTVTGLAYDSAGSGEVAFWKFTPFGYGSGPIVCDVIWYADTSTTSTHGVTWQLAVAAITPGVDTQNAETKAFAAAQQASTDLGSADPQKLIKTTVTISNLDNIAAGDEVWLRVTRLVSDAADDLTGDAILTSLRLSYSDT